MENIPKKSKKYVKTTFAYKEPTPVSNKNFFYIQSLNKI